MWDIQESDLDRSFLGQWEVTRVDDYLTPKAGTTSRSAIIRSKIDPEREVVKLYSYLPERYGLDSITVDGSYGLCGRVTERIKMENTKPNICFLYLHVIKAEDIPSRLKESGDIPGRYTLEGEAEIDDVVFNAQGNYTFPFTYYIKGEKNPVLWGLSLEIPIAKYNHYIRMRDIWYHDYEGAKIISSEDWRL